MLAAYPIAPEPAYVAAAAGTVMAASLGTGTALLDLRTNQYFSLDEVGTLVWQQLQHPSSKAALVQGVTEVYEIDAQSCAADIDLLLGELIAAALVEVQPGQAA